MSRTLLLDQSAWDLVLDVNGNIAVAENPYAIAQDVASAIRLFRGELWYDTRQGVPYFERILGKRPSVAYVKSRFIKAALSVAHVVKAKGFLRIDASRVMTGQVQVTDDTGAVSVVAVGKPPLSNTFILGVSTLDGGNVLG